PSGDPDGPGGWWLLFEPELHLGEDVIVPDIAGWRRTRLPVLQNVAAFTMAPDWVSEVLSPSTVPLDRGRKMAIYARERFAHLWIIDPILRTPATYRLEGGAGVLAGRQQRPARLAGTRRLGRGPCAPRRAQARDRSRGRRVHPSRSCSGRWARCSAGSASAGTSSRRRRRCSTARLG